MKFSGQTEACPRCNGQIFWAKQGDVFIGYDAKSGISFMPHVCKKQPLRFYRDGTKAADRLATNKGKNYGNHA